MSMGSQFKESVLESIRVERMVQNLNEQIEELRRETMKLMDERDKMRQERDRIRRIFCAMIASGDLNARDPNRCLAKAGVVAAGNGWDCFKQEENK